MKRRLQTLEAWFLYFMLYSIIGWVYEVFLEVIVYRWGYSDRGVLHGPYCPVYGVGALAFLLCFHRLMALKRPRWLRILKPLLIFLGCMAVATGIELITSYLLEWLTGSWPWQTYVDYAVNFQGRIALSPSVRFGLGGVFFLFLLQPLFERAVGLLSLRSRAWIARIAGVVFLADLLLTIM